MEVAQFEQLMACLVDMQTLVLLLFGAVIGSAAAAVMWIIWGRRF